LCSFLFYIVPFFFYVTPRNHPSFFFAIFTASFVEKISPFLGFFLYVFEMTCSSRLFYVCCSGKLASIPPSPSLRPPPFLGQPCKPIVLSCVPPQIPAPLEVTIPTVRRLPTCSIFPQTELSARFCPGGSFLCRCLSIDRDLLETPLFRCFTQR